ncbi:MAG: PIN domain-containing protein, partial [Pirellulales bacterium]|nr:PIN domain-containing protein [Pirellulales bacterium]
MPKTVILDSSALIRATVNSAATQSLFALSALGAVQVCVPRVVLDEWRTQFRDRLWKGHANLRDEVRGFLPRDFTSDPTFADLVRFSDLLKSIDPERVSIEVASATEKRYVLSICEVAEHHGTAVFEKYFAGTGCFSGQAKNRSDLPDAFIYEAVADVIQGAGKDDEVVFVVKDGSLRTAVERDLGIRCFETVQDLMDDDLLKAEQSTRAHEIGWQRILVAIDAQRKRFDELILEHEMREFPGRFSDYTVPLPEEFLCQKFRHFIIREWGSTELEHSKNAPGWLI